MDCPVRNSLAIAALHMASAFFLWCDAAPTPTEASSIAVTPASLTPEQSYKPVPQTIETIRVGQRMWIGENPSEERDLRVGTDIVDPGQWRKMVLRCPKRDGSTAQVEMLRPLQWLRERGVHTGGQVDIDVPECGIEGMAEVLDVQACPPISGGPGRVVTATFHHQAAQTIDVTIAGESEPIGSTPNHPIWSETQQDFVRADALRPGEEVRTANGTALVTSITSRGPPEPVYNLEVQFEHVYRVGDSGVLVHNGNPCDFVSSGELEASARTLSVNEVRNSAKEAIHAAQQAKARGVFATQGEATQAIKALTESIKRKGFPKGTVPDPLDAKSVLVPIGKGKAVFNLKNGRAQIETIIN